jgi:hypothetical protein
MLMLVSLAQASAHLRRDTSEDDPDLVLKIQAASAAVINYLKEGKAPIIDSNGGIDVDSSGDILGVPPEVQAATLILVGVLYRDRDFQDPAQWKPGYLPEAVKSLLYPLRNPSLA